MRNIKARNQGLMLRFSRNDRNQRFEWNVDVWSTCNDRQFFFSNQKFALYTGLLSPKGFRIKYSADADRDSADSTDSLGYVSAKLSSELYLAEYVKYIIYNICTICNI